ncbi:hypothetical protein JCM11602_02910 [Thermus brockianus]
MSPPRRLEEGGFPFEVLDIGISTRCQKNPDNLGVSLPRRHVEGGFPFTVPDIGISTHPHKNPDKLGVSLLHRHVEGGFPFTVLDIGISTHFQKDLGDLDVSLFCCQVKRSPIQKGVIVWVGAPFQESLDKSQVPTLNRFKKSNVRFSVSSVHVHLRPASWVPRFGFPIWVTIVGIPRT